MPPLLRLSVLWVCTALFLMRVMGQILVGIYAPAILPPWKEWYSGLLPYPWLLLSQLLLLMFMAVVNMDNLRRTGRFCVGSAGATKWLRRAASLYATVMIVRYVLRMALMPDQRWLGGCIPIVFHLVLASWVGALGFPLRNGKR